MRHVIPTTRPLLTTVWWPSVVCAALIALLAWGSQWDKTVADAFEAGRIAGRDEMADSVGDAYAQGMRDARAQQQAGLPIPAEAQP